MTTNKHSLIIDTTLYAGNFERELCAWLTGQTGECGVGGEAAEKARASLKNLQWWEDHIVQTADENGYFRPVAIAPTPGFLNDGCGGEYADTPEGRAQALPKYHASVQRYFEKEERQLKNVTLGSGGWTQEAVDRELARATARRDTSLAKTEVDRYPSYQSVEIFMNEEPPAEVLEEVRERLKKVLEDPYGTDVFKSYGETHRPAQGFNVIGIRLTSTPQPVPTARQIKF